MKERDREMAEHDFTRHPREFAAYRWYKPLLVALLMFVFLAVVQMALLAVGVFLLGDASLLDGRVGGYDGMNPYTASGALVELGSVAALLPALALAALIVRDRPFSSYATSRGGWSWRSFARCLVVAVAVVAVSTLGQMALAPSDQAPGPVLFTVAGFVACTLLVPLQCLAEEFAFRGLALQTVGAWTKMPVLAIAAQAALYASMHPYNALGVVAVLVDGVVAGFLALKTSGIEAAAALHIVNNLFAFYLGGFGIQPITANVDLASCIASVLADVAFAAIVLAGASRRNWFAPAREVAPVEAS